MFWSVVAPVLVIALGTPTLGLSLWAVRS